MDGPLTKRRDLYRRTLLENIVPFWMEHAIDHEYGGYHFSLGRHGELVDSDKSVWIHGRFIWLLSTLYHEVEPRPEWLEMARHGVDFLLKHCVAPNHKLYFLVARDGTPLRMRRYYYSECFAAMGLAAFVRASGEKQYARHAIAFFENLAASVMGALSVETKVMNREAKGLAPRMVVICAGQILRDTIGYDGAQVHVDRAIGDILSAFYKPELEVLMESVGPHGEIHDTFEGRLLNPGHAIEAAWFILIEAVRQGADDHLQKALNIIRWMWNRGWDREHGGLVYFRDVYDKPVQEYWHDMKFWWPHNEAEIATLMAWRITGNDEFRRYYDAVHDYEFALLPDPDGPEWFGYFHRDGSRSSDLKGNHWKGPFHIPRMLLYGMKLLETVQK